MQLKHGIIRFTSVVALLLVAYTFGCTGTSSRPIKKVSDITGKGYIELKSMTDHGNPYKDTYGAWDQWIYDHVSTERIAFEQGQKPEGCVVLTARVTPDGYLLPFIEKNRFSNEAIKRGETANLNTDFPFTVQAQGVVPPEIKAAHILAGNRLKGQYYNQVPKWLADSPPFAGMLMPNGDVVTKGELGSDTSGESGGCCGGSGDIWYRYNSSGELLRTTRNTWWYLYFDDIANDEPAGEFHNRQDGYIYFTDQESEEILSVWDWDGSRLDPPALPPMRDYHPFMLHRAQRIIDLYQGQNS